jgi:hypothetical protein
MGVLFLCAPGRGRLGISSFADGPIRSRFALGISLFALLLWVGVGDIFLRFALEEGHFFELATGAHALDIFEGSEPSQPQPSYLVSGSGGRRVWRFGRLTKSAFALFR